MSESVNTDDIPTSEIHQLMNSIKINSTTNKDFVDDKTQSEFNFNDKTQSEFNIDNNMENIVDSNTSSISEQIDQMIGENNKEFNFNAKSKSSSISYSDDNNGYNKLDGVTTELNDIVRKNKKSSSSISENNDYDIPKSDIPKSTNQEVKVKYIEEDDNEDIDGYETLNSNQKKLARMDMLRKLAELKKKGYSISNDYNINSDYYTMKEEYEYQLTIKGKDSFVKNTFCYGLNFIKLIEFANKKYDPLGIDLDGWNISVENSKEEVIDAIGEIYEKYHKPGSGVMSPELRLLLILVSSAVSTVIANSGAKVLASMFQDSKVIDDKDKSKILNNLNNNINNQPKQPIIYPQMNIKDEKQQMINQDINTVKQEINNRGYTIPAPKIPNSLLNTYNPQQQDQPINYQSNNYQSSNNVFDNLIKNQKMSKKMN